MIEVAPDIAVNVYLLAALGAAVGLIAGFAGVSGGYLLTPLLMVMGLPGPLAVGTSVALMSANNLIAVIRHRELGHLDLKMGLITAAGTMLGAEFGVRLLHSLEAGGERFADVSVLGALILILIVVGFSMAREVVRTSRAATAMDRGQSAAEDGEIRTAACRALQSLSIFPHIRFTKSKLRISGWFVLVIGIGVGVLSGLLGIGGGFMLGPALIYLIGQSSMMAVGTNLLGLFMGLVFSTFRHAMNGNVELGLALAMLIATAFGTFIGVRGTCYVRGLAVRYVLAASVVCAVFGPACRLLFYLTGAGAWDAAAKIVTIALMSVPVTAVVALLVLARRHVLGGEVPAWARRLIVHEPHVPARP